ncbi:MAG: hypothetical protein GX799_04045 [Crenarchaeota archaeon]|nr:hypothetical protein [Thermoproteota archaeon]
MEAEIVQRQQMKPQGLLNYYLVGFGARIDSGKQYKPLLDSVDLLSNAIKFLENI